MLGFAACLDLGVPCTCLVVYFLSYYLDMCHSFLLTGTPNFNCTIYFPFPPVAPTYRYTHMTLHFRSTWCAFVVNRGRGYSAMSTIVQP